MIDIAGVELTQDERTQLQNPLVGGIVLFSRNYQTPKQLTQLTSQLKSLRAEPLLITVDHEGGRVQRFREGFTLLPSMQSLGDEYLIAPKETLHRAEHLGFTMASELKACGIDLSFAPVLDLNLGVSKVLEGGRAISNDPQIIVDIARAYIDGMHRADMMATGKHFPGHGHVTLDSHFDLPVDDRDFNSIFSSDLIPFVSLLNHLDAVMPAHIIFSKVDDKPASLSRIWLKDILRDQLKFKGKVFSDCLSMEGAVKFEPDPTKRIKLSLEAGCDMVLVCNQPESVKEILENF
jgi:beta-N-acetylhexosaminidase